MNNAAITQEFYQLGLELEDEMQLLHELGQHPRDIHAYSEFGGFETAEAQVAFFECANRVTRIRNRMRELHCQMVINRLLTPFFPSFIFFNSLP